jgi:hypothetical protein
MKQLCTRPGPGAAALALGSLALWPLESPALGLRAQMLNSAKAHPQGSQTQHSYATGQTPHAQSRSVRTLAQLNSLTYTQHSVRVRVGVSVRVNVSVRVGV